MSENAYPRVKKWRHRTKERLIQGFGGKCIVCGYCKCLDAFDFHHIDPKEKDILISKLKNRSWEVTLQEAKKCVLLCANCHRELHAGLVTIEEKIYFDETRIDFQKGINRKTVLLNR